MQDCSTSCNDCMTAVADIVKGQDGQKQLRSFDIPGKCTYIQSILSGMLSIVDSQSIRSGNRSPNVDPTAPKVVL
jgi:hypothetical protein